MKHISRGTSRLRPERGPERLRRRAGFSLTETLVVISVASVIIGMAGMTIHRLLAAEQEVTRTARFAASVTRLSRAFRTDLHAARSVEIPAAPAGQPEALVATLNPGHFVRYEFDGHLATRVETRDGSQVHREAFHFAPRSSLHCTHDENDKLVKLELNLSTRSSGPDIESPPRKLLMEVAVARDHRFETSPSAEGSTP